MVLLHLDTLEKQEQTVKSAISFQNEYPLSFPQPGWSEQKPEDWWNAVVDGIKKLINGFDASEVAGIKFRWTDARSCYSR